MPRIFGNASDVLDLTEEEEGGGKKRIVTVLLLHVCFKLAWKKFVQLEDSDFPYYNQQGNQADKQYWLLLLTAVSCCFKC